MLLSIVSNNSKAFLQQVALVCPDADATINRAREQQLDI